MAAGTAGKDGGNRDIVFNASRQVSIFELEGAGGLGSHESFCADITIFETMTEVLHKKHISLRCVQHLNGVPYGMRKPI